MHEQNTCRNMKKGKEEKAKFSKILPNNQIITTCHTELQVQEMTMTGKLTMIGPKSSVFKSFQWWSNCLKLKGKFLLVSA